MRSHETTITVRFNEVDTYGVAWHGHYVAWMEVGRHELARRFDLDVESIAAAGFLAPVVGLELQFRHPARFDEELTVRTTLHRNETATLEFRSVIVDASGRTCAVGTTVHALTDKGGVLQYHPPALIMERVERLLAWQEGV